MTNSTVTDDKLQQNMTLETLLGDEYLPYLRNLYFGIKKKLDSLVKTGFTRDNAVHKLFKCNLHGLYSAFSTCPRESCAQEDQQEILPPSYQDSGEHQWGKNGGKVPRLIYDPRHREVITAKIKYNDLFRDYRATFEIYYEVNREEALMAWMRLCLATFTDLEKELRRKLSSSYIGKYPISNCYVSFGESNLMSPDFHEPPTFLNITISADIIQSGYSFDIRPEDD